MHCSVFGFLFLVTYLSLIKYLYGNIRVVLLYGQLRLVTYTSNPRIATLRICVSICKDTKTRSVTQYVDKVSDAVILFVWLYLASNLFFSALVLYRVKQFGIPKQKSALFHLTSFKGTPCNLTLR